MPKTKANVATSDTKAKRRKALTPEARENQMISLAINLAEQQLMNGTASSQVITHYLKLGTSKERLEKEKLEQENKLLRAKTEMIASQKETEALYREALDAMRTYSGTKSVTDNEDV